MDHTPEPETEYDWYCPDVGISRLVLPERVPNDSATADAPSTSHAMTVASFSRPRTPFRTLDVGRDEPLECEY